MTGEKKCDGDIEWNENVYHRRKHWIVNNTVMMCENSKVKTENLSFFFSFF